MNSLRKVKKSRKNMVPDENPEEIAKTKLIQFSNFDFDLGESDLKKNPDLILDADTRKSPVKQPKQKEKVVNTQRYFSNDLKKLTEGATESRGILFDYNENDHKFMRTFYSLSLRNSLAISNYVMTGNLQSERTKYQTKMNKSQYVVRQQRIASKLKKQQRRRSTSYFTSGQRQVEKSFARNKILSSKASVLNPNSSKYCM